MATEPKCCHLCPLPGQPPMNCYAAAEMESLRAMIRVKDKDWQQLRAAYANEVFTNGEAIDLLILVSQELRCGDRPTGHYCPKCDNSSYNILKKVEIFLNSSQREHQSPPASVQDSAPTEPAAQGDELYKDQS